MSAAALVDLLKRRLKAHGITYAQLATRLHLSEASVKRMVSRESFTLRRLEEVCRVVRIDFAELARTLSDELAGTSHLTVEQEREIVADPKLLLVALCAVESWTLEQIVDTYKISRVECIGYLARLDKLRIIELKPDNRIRPLVGRTLSWLPNGPFQRYFRNSVEAEYLNSHFDRSDELLLFLNGMLSLKSTAQLIAQLRKLATDFAGMHRDDLSLPLKERYGTSVLLATRPWEPRVFRALRRRDRSPVPAGRLLQPGLASAGRKHRKREKAT